MYSKPIDTLVSLQSAKFGILMSAMSAGICSVCGAFVIHASFFPIILGFVWLIVIAVWIDTYNKNKVFIELHQDKITIVFGATNLTIPSSHLALIAILPWDKHRDELRILADKINETYTIDLYQIPCFWKKSLTSYLWSMLWIGLLFVMLFSVIIIDTIFGVLVFGLVIFVLAFIGYRLGIKAFIHIYQIPATRLLLSNARSKFYFRLSQDSAQEILLWYQNILESNKIPNAIPNLGLNPYRARMSYNETPLDSGGGGIVILPF